MLEHNGEFTAPKLPLQPPHVSPLEQQYHKMYHGCLCFCVVVSSVITQNKDFIFQTRHDDDDLTWRLPLKRSSAALLHHAEPQNYRKPNHNTRNIEPIVCFKHFFFFIFSLCLCLHLFSCEAGWCERSSQVWVDPAANAEPLIAEDVRADIWVGRGRRRGDQWGKWEAERQGGAERIDTLFCSTPARLKENRVWRHQRQESDAFTENGLQTLQTK